MMPTLDLRVVVGAVLLCAACSGGGGAADAGPGGGRGGASGTSGAAGTTGASGSGGSTAQGGTSGAAGVAGASGGGSSGAAGATCAVALGSGGAGGAGAASGAGAGGSGGGGGGGTPGTGGTGGTAFQFTLVSPDKTFRSVACGPTVCYANQLDNTGGAYHLVSRLASTATAVDDFSSGLGGTSIASMLVDDADGLYLLQGGIGILLRGATAPSFAMVGDAVTSAPTARQGLVRDASGTLYVGTPTGVVALPPGGSTFAPVGCGLASAYAVVTDGTNLFAASSTVKVLRGGTATWTDAGSNSPTAVGVLVLDRAGRLFAIGKTNGTTGVHRLAADGSTWQDITAPLNPAGFDSGVTTNIVFDSQNYGYIISESTGEPYGSTFVARLPPGGTQWGTMGAPGFPSGAFSCEWLAIDALDRLVAACVDGLFRSTPLH